MGLLIDLSKKKIEELGIYLQKAAETIIEGKLFGFPTNSVYGIGGNPKSVDILERLCKIKFRDRTKGFLLLVSDLEEAEKVAEFNEVGMKLAEKFWPGQLTLILNRKEQDIVPLEVTANKATIGLRVPENKIILRVLEILKEMGYFGGIIGTSANFSGGIPAISGAEVAKIFMGRIDLILEGGKSKSQIATTIVDCTTNDIKILRQGLITEEEIQNTIREA